MISYQEIKKLVQGLIRTAMTSKEDDRAEARICGFDVRVRRIRRHGWVGFILERKAHWQTTFYREDPSRLADKLVQYAGAHT